MGLKVFKGFDTIIQERKVRFWNHFFFFFFTGEGKVRWTIPGTLLRLGTPGNSSQCGKIHGTSQCYRVLMMWGFEWCDMKCHSITRWGTIRVLREDPRSDWNVICEGLRLLLALLLTWQCQKNANEWGRYFSNTGKWSHSEHCIVVRNCDTS